VEILNPRILEELANGDPIALNLGSGGFRAPGYYNLDRRPVDHVDIVADLEGPLSALPEHSVSEVRASHVLEHIRNLPGLMEEVHRVLVPGGAFRIMVPHFANPLAHSDPTHVRTLGLYSFCHWVRQSGQPFRRKVPFYWPEAEFAIERIELGFRPTGRTASRLAALVNRSPATQELFERNLTGAWWPYELHVTLTPVATVAPVPRRPEGPANPT
jgi:SAM-dependent methyltransferase